MRRCLLILEASSGTQAATALPAASGHDLALPDSANANVEGAEAVARRADDLGRRVTTRAARLSDSAGIASHFACFDVVHGCLDGIVNNAGMVATASGIADFNPNGSPAWSPSTSPPRS